MGTLCSKRQTTKPKRQSTELQCDRITNKSDVNLNFVQITELRQKEATFTDNLEFNSCQKEDKMNNLELSLAERQKRDIKNNLELSLAEWHREDITNDFELSLAKRQKEDQINDLELSLVERQEEDKTNNLELSLVERQKEDKTNNLELSLVERQKEDKTNNLELSLVERQKEDKTNNLDLSLVERQKEDKTNNLELYLNDVYEKECVFKAEKEEVEFIQTGIETLVQKIVDLVLGGYSVSGSEKEYYKRMKESLVEVFFPLKTKHKLKSFFVKRKSSRNRIIKVGSFYEETKNNFPDEFDFIFLLFCVKEEQYPDPYCETFDKAAVHVKTVTTDNRDALKYVSPDGIRKLNFDQYLRKHGPAFMLRFIYNNGSGEERYIHVDLVPAFKIIVIHNPDWYATCVNMDVKPKSFRKEALSAGNCLLVHESLSFTETEVHFLKNILSKKHVKVYRILKFLINGHGDGEILELYHLTICSIFSLNKGYSSYLIKTMMIYHHDECTNPNTEEIGDCVIQILDDIYKFSISNEFPTFSGLAIKIPIPILPYLKILTGSLKSMECAEYEYESMKSVSRQYLDALNRDDPRNALWFKYLDALDGDDPSFDSFMEYSDDLDEDDPDFNYGNRIRLMLSRF